MSLPGQAIHHSFCMQLRKQRGWIKILNINPYVLLFKRNLVRPRASQLKLSVNNTEESHTIGLQSIQIDSTKKAQFASEVN